MTASLTSNFGLQRLAAGDQFSTNGYQFFDSDRAYLDALLRLALNHHHTGTVPVLPNPPTGLVLTLDTTQGHLPAGSRVYYRYTLVDGNGLETGPSPEVYIDTPTPLTTPMPPSIADDGITSCLLPPGLYSYCISAYSGSTSFETQSSAVITFQVQVSSLAPIITFPTAPPGTTGWNIYRRAPNDALFLFTTSVLVANATHSDVGEAQNPNRTIPLSNTSRGTNAVVATLPPKPPHIYNLKIVSTGTTVSAFDAPITYPADTTYPTSLTVPVVVGTVYDGAIDVIGAGGGASLNLFWLNNSGAVIGSDSSPPTTINPGTWTTVQVHGVAPVGCTRLLFGAQVVNNAGGAGDVYYLSLPSVSIGGGPNLLLDQNFTSIPGATPTGWSPYQYSTVSSFLPTSVDPSTNTVQPPVGYTWKLYRTTVLATYTNSLVHWVVEVTVQGGSIIVPTYTDVGNATLTGSPPALSQLVSPLPSVNLERDIVGRLDLANLDGVPFTLVFHLAGTVTVKTLDTVWVNEYPSTEIVGMRAALGVGSHPVSTRVQAVVRQGSGATPTYTDVLEAEIPVGLQIGPFTSIGATPPTAMVPGDSLAVDVRQAGGGATPLDKDLTVTVYCIARYIATGDLYV